MSSETFTKTISGNDYSYTQLSATKSILLKFKLTGIIGGVAGELSEAIGGGEKEQTKAFGLAISSVFKENDPEKILSIIENIFEPAFINGERIDIDKHFQGKMSEMYAVLFWILKKEYGSFLEEALNIL